MQVARHPLLLSKKHYIYIIYMVFIAVFKYNDTFQKKKIFKKVSITLIFTLACSDFFGTLKLFF
jgi:hypothetical protein